MVKIDFLFWKECPSYPKAWERLNQALKQKAITAEIQRIEVRTEEEVDQYSFPGSPTIRVNGEDIDPKGARDQRLGLSCRIYWNDSGRAGPLPSEKMIQRALDKVDKEGGRG